MKKIKLLLIILGCMFVLGACSENKDISFADDTPQSNISVDVPVNDTQGDETFGDGDVPTPDDEASIIYACIENMTLREKVGQLFIIRPDSLDLTQTQEQIEDPSAKGVTALSDEMAAVLRDYPVGGIVLFGKNIVDSEQLINLIGSLQNTSGIPLFMVVDEEGGIVARLANHSAFDLPKYASAAAVGASEDPADALDMGNTIGAYLHDFGFNMNFAPVGDVNTNPDNPVIGSRAFSSNAAVAADMAKAMAEGLKSNIIIPVFKHFPGHGDTAEDSHNGIAISYKTKAEMESCEWLPYESLTNRECVMIGHIATPNITEDLTPGTMTDKIIDGILRQQLGFDGVVITDSLEMDAITNEYASDEVAIMAINAGCDILLSPEHFTEVFDAVVSAVENGTISEEHINESVYRILLLKQIYGITD